MSSRSRSDGSGFSGRGSVTEKESREEVRLLSISIRDMRCKKVKNCDEEEIVAISRLAERQFYRSLEIALIIDKRVNNKLEREVKHPCWVLEDSHRIGTSAVSEGTACRVYAWQPEFRSTLETEADSRLSIQGAGKRQCSSGCSIPHAK